MLTYGPSTVQECVDIMYEAFDKADKYRCPVMILGDGMLGQIMEAVELPEMKDTTKLPEKEWATTGKGYGKTRKIINSLYIQPDDLEEVTERLFARYAEMAENETKCEEYMTDDAEIVLTGYGTVARVAKSAVNILRKKGIKAGLVRPITLYPFPTKVYEKIASRENVKEFLCLELSMGQMVEDVKLSVNGKKPVRFYGRTGGNVISPEDIVNVVLGEVK